jgi:hypothetical protein
MPPVHDVKTFPRPHSAYQSNRFPCASMRLPHQMRCAVVLRCFTFVVDWHVSTMWVYLSGYRDSAGDAHTRRRVGYGAAPGPCSLRALIRLIATVQCS